MKEEKYTFEGITETGGKSICGKDCLSKEESGVETKVAPRTRLRFFQTNCLQGAGGLAVFLSGQQRKQADVNWLFLSADCYQCVHYHRGSTFLQMEEREGLVSNVARIT